MFFYPRPVLFREFDLLPALLEDDSSHPTHPVAKRNVNELMVPRVSDDDDKDFQVSFDVPGVKAQDLEITIHNNMLRVSGQRTTILNEGRTVKKSRVSHARTLPDNVHSSQLKANLADGVLVVTAPRKAKPEPVKIAITTEPLETVIKMDESKEEVLAPTETDGKNGKVAKKKSDKE